MKTKSDIQLQLLKEIDEICLKNNLHYILVGTNSLNAFRNHTIKNGSRITAIAMTLGDIERFREIVEREYSETRYIEGLFNNSRYNGFNFSYGDRNTIDFHVTNLNQNKNHGINIRIYPIRKNVDNLNYKLLIKEQKLRRFMNKRVENDNFWYIRAGLKVMNALYSVTGGGKRYYFELKKLTFIDKWEDIQDYDMVRMGNKELDTKFLKKEERYSVDGLDLPFPNNVEEYFSDIYGEDFNEIIITPRTQRIRDIVDTEFSYTQVLDETHDILKEIRTIHEDMLLKRKKFDDEKRSIYNVWHLVEMTDEQIAFIDYFKDNIDDLSKYDLDDPNQFQKLYEILTPVIKSLEKYSKRGMTYSIDPKTDKLIEDVLIRSGDEKLVREINEISKKEYFVE